MHRRYLLLIACSLTGCGARVSGDGASESQTEDDGESESSDGESDETNADEDVCDLECEDAVEVAEGIVDCHGRYYRVHGGTYNPTITAEGCKGDEDVFECTSDADCKSGEYGRCLSRYENEATTICRCEYSCSTDDDCADGRMCVPVPASWPVCASAGCRGSEDCECGLCGIAAAGSWCSGWTYITECRTREDLCGTVDMTWCALGGCFPNDEGVWTCHYSEC